ncbi:MAG: nuclear transport factor 2 family protein [Gemmatimonadota bacterium]|nr:nuclear transport factor 2 family protein [Gemmatimonadota bacterium]
MRPRIAVSLFAVAGLLASMSTAATAQTWSPEQLGVWGVIEAQWQAAAAEDGTWPDRFLHDQFRGWANEFPAPRDKSSTERWMRYSVENSTTLMHELFPLNIIVQGNIAVAHYLYAIATENRKGERRTTHGRFTDILVRDGDRWRFIAWHGGDDPGGED